jgi:lysyl-tRNA synthetase class 2
VCTVVAAWLVGARSWFVVELARPSLRRLLGTAVLAGLGVPPLLVLLEGDHRDGTTGTLGLMCVLSFAGAASLALGRRIAPVAAAGARDRAADLVRTFGSDTLDAFKLRDDARYLESPSGKAVLAYRLSAGVMLVAGDPVGPVSEIPALLGRAREIAARHGLRLAVLNAGSRAAATWRAAGLRGLYLGDEAIVDIDGFSLEGRSIRKVRQSVTRLRKAGYTASVESVRLLPPAERGHLAGLAALWRGAAPERGFTMACTLEDAAADDGLVAVARDADGVARALMLLLPAYGRSAYSLALMRRDPNTPNGLTEFMVADTIERLGERGVAELSLNFAFLGRCLRGGDSRRLRAVRRLLRLGDRWFQLERLYRFNDKFFPRWQPRYLLVESFRTMPRTALSAMVVEGLLPGLPVRPWRR